MVYCPNCNHPIESNQVRCSYCKFLVKDSIKLRNMADDELKERFEIIDNLLQNDKDYKNENNETIELLLNKLDKFIENKNNDISNQKMDEVFKKINDLEEELQTRFETREEIKNLSIEDSTQDFIEELLYKRTNPEIHAAAFKIRSTTERLLRDKFKFKYDNENRRFELYPMEMYWRVTNSRKVAREINEDNIILNWFIHESKYNDDMLKEKFKSKEKQVEFLSKVYKLRKQYGLV